MSIGFRLRAYRCARISRPPMPAPPVVTLDPYNGLGKDNFQGLQLYAFDEDQDTRVTGSPPKVDLPASTGPSGLLWISTPAASHWVFFGPVAGKTWQEGWVRFDSAIPAGISSTKKPSDRGHPAPAGFALAGVAGAVSCRAGRGCCGRHSPGCHCLRPAPRTAGFGPLRNARHCAAP